MHKFILSGGSRVKKILLKELGVWGASRALLVGSGATAP